MRGPKPETDISDRCLECQEDMEAAANSLIDQALAAGWTETEACLALQELADWRLLSSQANRETALQIRKALAWRGKPN